MISLKLLSRQPRMLLKRSLKRSKKPVELQSMLPKMSQAKSQKPHQRLLKNLQMAISSVQQAKLSKVSSKSPKP